MTDIAATGGRITESCGLRKRQTEPGRLKASERLHADDAAHEVIALDEDVNRFLLPACEDDNHFWHQELETLQSAPYVPSSAVVPKNRPALTVSAPNVDRAIRTLKADLARDPNSAEVAGKLQMEHWDYLKFREYLKELETGNFLAKQDESEELEESARFATGPIDDPLFCCLRFETEQLLRDAIGHLPACEHLLISCYYETACHTKSMNMKVELVDAAVGEVRAAAFVEARALHEDRRRTSEFRSRPSWQTSPSPVESRSCLKVREDQGNDRVENPLIFVTGSQSGWLPSKRSWVLLGWREHWNHFFMTWYCVNDKRNLIPTRRQERYNRELGFS